jgi:predicted enzyme related to lactoylglutathione lyase
VAGSISVSTRSTKQNLVFGGPTIWFDVDDLQATFDRFVASGAGVRYPPELKPMGDVLASLEDLDRNVFGLVQR